ncbi:MAG TPA: UDP-2,3-diacylglucosamine diphosphatase [Nevskiaceae bacterium]|nr:UDP-2,3-diacylglucosamine diphosphatase [Nevskiaceae bacterium]
MYKNRTITKHRTLWVSDVHLGSPGAKARELTDFLKRNDCEQLYLVGDIFDGWKMKSRFYWTPDHSRVIKAIISKARRGTKVYYLAGNHDGFMRQFVKNQLRLGKVRIAHEVVHTTADGRRLLVTHGDTFDDVINGLPWLAYAGDVAYEALMEASKLLNRAGARMGLPYWSLSAFTKTAVKTAVQYWSGVDNKMLHRCRSENLAGVVSGHTHHAEIRMLRPGITLHNCGDWVESCTALTEDRDGNIEIVNYCPQPSNAGAAEAAIAAVSAPPPWVGAVSRAAKNLGGIGRRAVRRSSRKPARVRTATAATDVAVAAGE